VNLTAVHKFKAKGTRAEEESVPRQGRRGPSVQGWFKRLSDLPVFPKQISILTPLPLTTFCFVARLAAFQKVPVNPIRRAFRLPAVIVTPFPLSGLAL